MRPIVIIGAGGIVNDAHLPAYKIAGYEVAGIFDIDKRKAIETAQKFEVPTVFENLAAAIADPKVVFDVAVPGKAMIEVLKQLPTSSVALLQKPMGHDYEDAKQILKITHEKMMIAGVNFQLRYAPYIRKRAGSSTTRRLALCAI